MYYSQDKQDEILEKYIFKGYKNGFFVDVGAHNGKSINNTLYFEENNNWTGICIEPIAKIYDELKLNRPECININCAIDMKDGKSDFILNDGYSEMISGLKTYYDSRHFDRLDNEIKVYGGNTNTVEVETMKLSTIFDKYNVKKVEYLSIDVEGAELSVIQSIDFDKVFIDVIGFENNYDDVSKTIREYLENKGYILVAFPCMDAFMIHQKSVFTKNLFLKQVI